MNFLKLTVSLSVAFACALACGPAPALASAILGSDLGTFAVLGGQTVTNTGPTTINGNLGVFPGSAITGFPPGTLNGTEYTAGAFAGTAQSQLSSAITSLGSLGPGTTLSSSLTGRTLLPGVYTVPAGTTNLAGILTLNGNGNPNAFWDFQMPSTLITSSGSGVDVINTGAGASVYWNVGSSATLGTDTSFEGNILASTSISLDAGATIGCGRALASTGSVTLDANTVSTGCTGSVGVEGIGGSNGLSGGEFAATPESGTAILFGLGLTGMLAFRKRLFFI